MARAAGLITVVGDLVTDIVVWTSAATRAGTDNPATITRSRGGSGANVAVAAAAAGARARFIGRVGTDEAAAWLAAEVRRAGVDVRLQHGGRTGCVVVLVDSAGERTMFPDRGAAAELGPIDAADLADTAVLHVPLYGFLDDATGNLRAAADQVRDAGGAVTIDLSASSTVDHLGAAAVRRLVAEVAPAIVFANVDEATAAGLAALAPPPGGYFVIKDGPRPATIVQADGRRVSIAAAPMAAVRDTTGAGDAFAGMFLARWVAGAPPDIACADAHLAAAGTLGVPGAATTGAPP